MAYKKPRLTWRKEKNETGLARVAQGPRGYQLFLDGARVADVSHYSTGYRQYHGFYWSCPTNEQLGIRWRNTAAEGRIVDDIEDAKRECREYIEGCLAAIDQRAKDVTR